MAEFLVISPLDALDLLLMLAGGVVLLVGAARWVRAWPRDPLRGAPIRLNILSPAWLWLALLCYGLATLVAQAVAVLYSPPVADAAIARLLRSILAGNLSQIFVIVASLWILGQTFVAGWRGAGIGRNPLASDFRDAVKGFLAAFCLCSLVVWGTQALIHTFAPDFQLPLHLVFQALKHPDTPRFMSWVAIGGAFMLAPIAEELLFRGILQTTLHRVLPARAGSLRHRWGAMLLASLIFGLMHLQVPQHVPAMIVLAMILGYQYERTGSLAVPILVHMLFNGKSLLWSWLQSP